MNWQFKMRANIQLGSFFLICIFVLSSCKSKQEKELEQFVEKIESTDMDTYRSIEYMSMDTIETYRYLKNNSLFTSWKFNKKTNRFQNVDEQKIKTFDANPQKNIATLRTKIQSIKVVAITQGFKGYKQFWVADNEYISYIYQSEVEIDNPLLNQELKTAKDIKSGWYFTRLKVCRNRNLFLC